MQAGLPIAYPIQTCRVHHGQRLQHDGVDDARSIAVVAPPMPSANVQHGGQVKTGIGASAACVGDICRKVSIVASARGYGQREAEVPQNAPTSEMAAILQRRQLHRPPRLRGGPCRIEDLHDCHVCIQRRQIALWLQLAVSTAIR